MNIVEQRLEDLIKHYIENYAILFSTLDSFFAALASLLYLKSGIKLSEIEDKLDEILSILARKYLYTGLLNHLKRSPIFALHDYILNSELYNFFNDLRQELIYYYKEIDNIIFK